MPEPDPPARPADEHQPDWDPLTAPLELLLGRGPDPVPQPTPPAGSTGPTWPCASCAAENPLALSACAACGAGFLEALVRAEPPLLVLPLLGDVTQWSRLHWLGLAAALLVLVLVLTLLLGAVVS